jgi:hypothetical protein
MTSQPADAEWRARHVPGSKEYRARQSGSQPEAVRFSYLGVLVRDGQILRDGSFRARRIGALAGARAEITDGTRPHRIGAALAAAPLSLGAGLLIGLTRAAKASAFVVFADGSVHEHKLNGARMIQGAQRDVVKFNALAGAQRPPA